MTKAVVRIFMGGSLFESLLLHSLSLLEINCVRRSKYLRTEEKVSGPLASRRSGILVTSK